MRERLGRVAGVWVGTYTHLSPGGERLEQFASRQETRLCGNRWYERIIYRYPDGRSETLDFRAGFDATGERMVFDDPHFHGEAFALGEDVLVFPYAWKDRPDRRTVETVVFSGEDRKSRVWQTFEHGELARVSVIVERRVAETPADWE